MSDARSSWFRPSTDEPPPASSSSRRARRWVASSAPNSTRRPSDSRSRAASTCTSADATDTSSIDQVAEAVGGHGRAGDRAPWRSPSPTAARRRRRPARRRGRRRSARPAPPRCRWPRVATSFTRPSRTTSTRSARSPSWKTTEPAGHRRVTPAASSSRGGPLVDRIEERAAAASHGRQTYTRLKGSCSSSWTSTFGEPGVLQHRAGQLLAPRRAEAVAVVGEGHGHAVQDRHAVDHGRQRVGRSCPRGGSTP